MRYIIHLDEKYVNLVFAYVITERYLKVNIKNYAFALTKLTSRTKAFRIFAFLVFTNARLDSYGFSLGLTDLNFISSGCQTVVDVKSS